MSTLLCILFFAVYIWSGLWIYDGIGHLCGFRCSFKITFFDCPRRGMKEAKAGNLFYHQDLQKELNAIDRENMEAGNISENSFCDWCDSYIGLGGFQDQLGDNIIVIKKLI